METSEVKDWLQNTRDTIQTTSGKGKGDDKLGQVLER
jgi:hypothetical protein